MQDTDKPSLFKTNIRALNKFKIPAINSASLIFFSILFDFENTGIKNSSAKPEKTLNAITLTEVM